MACKPDFCQNCPITEHTEGYVPLLKKSSTTLVVGDMADEHDLKLGKPFSGGPSAWLTMMCAKAGIARDSLNLINVLGCKPKSKDFPTDNAWHWTSRQDAHAAIAYCAQHHLWPAIDELKPSKIIALGNEALEQLTGKSGILVWRGSALPLKTDLTQLKVLPTLHPKDLMKDANMLSVAINDLKKPLAIAPEHYNLFASSKDLEEFDAKVLSVDFEWDWQYNITLCGLSDKFNTALVSDWGYDKHKHFKRIFEQATDLIGHNFIEAERVHLLKEGFDISKARIHDTILKQHLVHPHYKRSLAFVSSVFLNKPFWKGRGEGEEDAEGNITNDKVQYKTWNSPTAIPRALGGYGGCTSEDEAFRLYNARDTDTGLQINHHLDNLLAQYNLTKLYWNVSLPAALICQDIGEAGMRINPTRVGEIRTVLLDELVKLEQTLPEGLKPYDEPIKILVDAPLNTYRPKGVKCKGSKKAASTHSVVSVLFSRPEDILACPVCQKDLKTPKLQLVKKLKQDSTKYIQPWNSAKKVSAYAKDLGLKPFFNRKKGVEAADVNARKGWGRTHPEFKIIDRLKDLSTEANTFAKAKMQELDRLFFQLKVYGTKEGRLSSKGRRQGIDPNIQNQPESVRRIYIPDQEDWTWLNFDYSSGENKLTAFLAQDHARLARLSNPDYNEHLDLARHMFQRDDLTKSKEDYFTIKRQEGKKVTEHTLSGYILYDIAKHINHGSNYGMSYIKLGEYLEMNGLFFSERECKDFLEARKAMNPGTARWQEETIARAKKDGFLRNVFGRILWFSSRNVNTTSLAFLPASTLADIMLRVMIAHFPNRFGKELAELGVQVVGEMEPNWRISAQIHDALLNQGPKESLVVQAARTKAIMSQPWAELDGFSLGVEGSIGPSWGELELYDC